MFLRKNTGIEYIIAGLGNPGAEYEKTRHNAGFRFIDRLCADLKLPSFRLKHMALCVKGEMGGHGVLIMKPQTYMNKSGESIADAVRYYKLDPQHVIVVSDDTSLATGKMRLRRSGSAGGHNGLKSIIKQLGTEDFPRLKIGVGQKPDPEYDLADWVLGKMTDDELADTAERYPRLERAIVTVMDGDFEKAVQIANSDQA